MNFQDVDPKVNQLSNAVIGAAIEVHKALGPGFLESVYEEALAYELRLRRVLFSQQHTIGVSYKGQMVGESRLDFLVDSCLVVELKAVEGLESSHTAQVLSYLKATQYSLGLLINFNVPILKQGIRRVAL